MLTHLVKYAAALMLVFALISLSGVVTTAVAFSGQQVAEKCCGDEREDAAPADAGECADIECRCFGCAASTVTLFSVHLLCTSLAQPLQVLTAPFPSEHHDEIEYPPELS